MKTDPETRARVRRFRAYMKREWPNVRFVIVKGSLGDPNAPLTELQKQKMESMKDALNYPGLPPEWYERD